MDCSIDCAAAGSNVVNHTVRFEDAEDFVA